MLVPAPCPVVPTPLMCGGACVQGVVLLGVLSGFADRLKASLCVCTGCSVCCLLCNWQILALLLLCPLPQSFVLPGLVSLVEGSCRRCCGSFLLPFRWCWWSASAPPKVLTMLELGSPSPCQAGIWWSLSGLQPNTQAVPPCRFRSFAGFYRKSSCCSNPAVHSRFYSELHKLVILLFNFSNHSWCSLESRNWHLRAWWVILPRTATFTSPSPSLGLFTGFVFC